MELFDAHMHTTHDADFFPDGESFYLSCAGGPEDWPPLLRENRRGIRIFLGIHPLKIPGDSSAANTLLEELEGLIEASPQAGLGECGLDHRIYREIPRSEQEKVLRRQIRLAVRFRRPLNFHQVRASGALAEVLEEERPETPFLLHGFKEKPETAKRYLKLGAYLSLGPGRHWEREDFKEMVRRLPRNRILLESDWPYAPAPYEKTMQALYKTASEALRIDREELLTIVESNGTVFKN